MKKVLLFITFLFLFVACSKNEITIKSVSSEKIFETNSNGMSEFKWSSIKGAGFEHYTLLVGDDGKALLTTEHFKSMTDSSEPENITKNKKVKIEPLVRVDGEVKELVIDGITYKVTRNQTIKE